MPEARNDRKLMVRRLIELTLGVWRHTIGWTPRADLAPDKNRNLRPRRPLS